jgi:hypothetical protein
MSRRGWAILKAVQGVVLEVVIAILASASEGGEATLIDSI